MRVETKTEIQTKEVNVNTYFADDGTEFDDVKKCEMYEANLAKQELRNKLELIQTCKELDGHPPVDGGEYYENHDFCWYLPKTQGEIDILTEFYQIECGISTDSIGEWICVEAYDISDPTEVTYAMSIKQSIEYTQKLFNALGYKITIEKLEEIKV